MTADQRNDWAKTTAGGFLGYVLKSILLSILTNSVLIGVGWLIIDQIFDGTERYTLGTFLMIGCLIGVLNGWVSAYFRWLHNESEYSHRQRAPHS